MPYFEQIRRNIEDQQLIDIYVSFELGLDTTAFVEQHDHLSQDVAYKNSDKCDVIERCLIRFGCLDQHPAILRRDYLIDQLKQDEKQQRISQFEALKNIVKVRSLTCEVDKLRSSNQSLTKQVDELREELDQAHDHADYLASECNRLSSQSGSSIISGAEQKLSASTLGWAQIFLAREINKEVARKWIF